MLWIRREGPDAWCGLMYGQGEHDGPRTSATLIVALMGSGRLRLVARLNNPLLRR